MENTERESSASPSENPTAVSANNSKQEDFTSTAQAAIPKRSVNVRGRLRKKQDDSDDDEQRGVDREKLKDLKLIHTLRVRKEGISAEVLNQADAKERKSSSHKETSSSFSSQFSSKMDYGLQEVIPHENIMEQFINEKLGLVKEAEQPKKPRTAEDELYVVPEELKVVSEVESKKVKLEADEGTASSWSTGIAEVALPMSFKLKNIEATEKAAQSMKMQSYSRTEHAAFQRFQVHDSNLISPVPVSESSDSAREGSLLQKRSLKSTDDLAVQRYKRQVFKK